MVLIHENCEYIVLHEQLLKKVRVVEATNKTTLWDDLDNSVKQRVLNSSYTVVEDLSSSEDIKSTPTDFVSNLKPAMDIVDEDKYIEIKDCNEYEGYFVALDSNNRIHLLNNRGKSLSQHQNTGWQRINRKGEREYHNERYFRFKYFPHSM